MRQILQSIEEAYGKETYFVIQEKGGGEEGYIKDINSLKTGNMMDALKFKSGKLPGKLGKDPHVLTLDRENYYLNSKGAVEFVVQNLPQMNTNDVLYVLREKARSFVMSSNSKTNVYIKYYDHLGGPKTARYEFEFLSSKAGDGKGFWYQVHVKQDTGTLAGKLMFPDSQPDRGVFKDKSAAIEDYINRYAKYLDKAGVIVVSVL